MIAAAGQAPKKWTILYYFDGKNNLAPMAKHSFSSLDQVGSNDDVNLVAQIGLPKQNVMQGLITKGDSTNMFEDIGDQNMGSADNVQKFVEWGMKNYPAENYALVMWDHGAGFMGSMTDDEAKSMITNNDLAKALGDVKQKHGGKGIDVLGWNACLMNQLETAYELKNVAKYMVGSEEVEAGLRIPLPKVFGTTPQHTVASDVQEAIKTKGNLTPEELAKLFVFESKNQFGSTMFTPTQSAIDLGKIDGVSQKAHELSSLLLETVQKDPSMVDVLRKDIRKTQHFLAADMYIEPYSDYRDLGDFARVILGNKAYTDPRIAQTAKELQGAVHEAVVAEWHAPVSSMGGRSLEGATGLSAYIPADYGFDKKGKSAIDNVPQGGTHGHENTSFAKDTSWDKMLQAVAKDDDWKGKFPKTQRMLMNFGPIASYYGYMYAYDTLTRGALAASHGWTIWPIMNFPFFIPIPQVVGIAAAGVGGALKLQKGVSKLAEGIRRTDSPTANRARLITDGALDTVVGAGSLTLCGALLSGHTGHIGPVAAGVLTIGLGKLAYGLARGLASHGKTKGMSVQDKIDAMADTRPKFSSMTKVALPAAPAAAAPEPGKKVDQQPPVQQPAIR